MKYMQTVETPGGPGKVIGRLVGGGVLVVHSQVNVAKSLWPAGNGPCWHRSYGWCEKHQQAYPLDGKCEKCQE